MKQIAGILGKMDGLPTEVMLYKFYSDTLNFFFIIYNDKYPLNFKQKVQIFLKFENHDHTVLLTSLLKIPLVIEFL